MRRRAYSNTSQYKEVRVSDCLLFQNDKIDQNVGSNCNNNALWTH